MKGQRQRDRLWTTFWVGNVVGLALRIAQGCIDGWVAASYHYEPHEFAARVLQVPRTLTTLIAVLALGAILIRWIARATTTEGAT